MKLNIDGMLTAVFVIAFFLAGSVSAEQIPMETEVYSFKIRAEVTYRCYGGYGSKKDADSRTKVVCDNKTKEKVLFNGKVKLAIRNEPDPVDSKNLEGSLEKSIQFEGRKFIFALSLFKNVDSKSRVPYRLRIVAEDDEPRHRATATYAEADQVRNFNTLSVEYSSMGQPEEIVYVVHIEPVK